MPATLLINRHEIAQQTIVENGLMKSLTEGLRNALAWRVHGDDFSRKLSTVQFICRSFQRHLERLMTLEEAEHSKMQNVIVRALGTDDTVEPDLADHEFSSEDVLLLCSDGLSRYVKEDKMTEAVNQESLEQACSDLIEAAKAGGSDDNITCLLIRATPLSWKNRFFGRLSGPGSQKSST